MQITMEQIDRVYEGRPGCACGCNGTYKDPSKFRDDAERVLRLLNKKLLTEPHQAAADGTGLDVTKSYVWWQTATRVTAIYLKE